MVITILTTGSRGDTQPYVALGLALQKAGHHVRLVGFENYESFVKSYGLEFVSIPGDVAKIAASESIKGARTETPLQVARSFKKLKSFIFGVQKDFFAACHGADVIIFHPGATIGYFTAAHLHIPAVLATPFPMTATADFPSLIFYDKIRLGRWFNRLSHTIFNQIMWSTSRGPIKQFWKAQFGRVPVPFTSPFSKQNAHRLPTVVSGSNYVFPQPADWPATALNSGYWFLDEPTDWKPSAALLNFLESGPPPVYIGFGSVGNPDLAEQTTRIALQALARAGQRGVLATGWDGMSDTAHLPETVFMLESAPHSWLFPRMAAVVHHGGAGTTAAGLRSGVPSIIIPHGNDQFAWGRRVHELGVGPAPIPRKQLTAENLADAIQAALTPATQTAAHALGLHIQSENGAETAAAFILQTIGVQPAPVH